ncbi:FAST kinase domain-containing protein 1, mitochondrial isoform X1 [Pteropus vampyrus]|uniref:FAST kinase domain-containing protein 1, mitochondrial isoform X1 n=1 Tax=Pteropus vampyrus TaxID=132908 RepID=A0A6P6CDN1_PTEVA|nr:FAST kinase domain-containing protein 1, mitochondrial isoform X1 [Pteropus vampyrus]XP_011356264.2 FAST kinase domain-containing protein 1, mitochondrial isoform X1 [Pteropus vampyrus]XP_011356271.2 FAST kinase domain-containing protein 1, mitochondrial isoform X1 [Pteropus vampyrus]XP_011356280.2 FAST kinase domain-containing protein 1, mitochondrial isoform X1 [Pteropus vampyrus]XP_011356289.2 FAST kinase domain-containing protein 1, mitochondrial isoform X1 [Pteropus vampyrus]XP_0113562
MFRLRAICPFSWRVFHFRPFSCETLIRQMDKCTDEEQVFDLIEKNKAIFSEKQVGYAFNILWQFQKQKTSLFKSVECIRDHPQFLTLYNLTTNKMEFMNDDNLVNVLYITQHFAVEAHDPLVEALVTEAWRRLERFDINVLSKFSSCLADQHLNFSPLMGKIADIVNRKLETIQDLRSLSVLMVSISSLISQRFQDQLVNKTELLFDTIDSSQVNIARRIVQFLRNIKYSYYPLLERCNKVFLSHVNHLDLESISKILSLYHFLQFHSFEFVLMAKKRLTEMIPQFDHPASFVKLFVALGPMAGPEEKKQLESTILLMSEELTSQQALAVMGAMEEMESRNSRLIKKIASILHKHLDDYKPVELLKITKALIFLHFQSKELFVKLKELLHSYLKISVKPSEISSLVCAISMLPSPHLDEVGISRIEAVLPQCDLNDLNGFATSILRWIQYDCMHLDSTGKQLKLLQKLDHYGHQSLQKCNNLNLLWEELKSLKGDWFAQSLLEETIATLQRLVDEINYMNVAGIASFISRTNCLSTLLLDRIASVVLQQIEKIHPFSVLAIILPFSILNYDPPQRNEFFGTCIQHLNSYLTLLDPLMLVFLGFSLATLEYFPEDLLKTIFNIKFLDRLDSQLELLCSSLNRRVQFRLMELNRAVCLECPEYQIPWFHDRFCQQHYNKDIGSMNGAQQQISKMLAEILGGINCVKASVLTPYYHMIDFECILDKRKKPLPYGSHNITLGKLPEMHWESNTQIVGSRLPPGAERIALEFLDLRAFCTNIPHLKGKSAMKKRHLEILGYRVIQIPHFEWNSMALSTKDARMDYLRERIFGEDKKYSRK